MLASMACPLAQQTADPRSSWAPVVLMIIIGVGFAVGNVALSILIGPSRQGSVKAGTYESGMVPIGTARRRFNVRFYIVAMIFLVIDVDIIFFYPWATIFAPYSTSPNVPKEVSLALLNEMLVILALQLQA
jgi:NADH-quinone oxidoreductase subunit A